MAMEFVIAIVVGIVIGILFSYFYFRAKVESIAMKLSEEYGQKVFESRKAELEAVFDAKYKAELEKWKIEAEKVIREDAIRRSAATILGKVGEHLAPILIFSNYGISPKDLRFIGTPIDYIAFKGLNDGKPEEILFIEVKSGESGALTTREKAVRDLVESKKVRWLLIHMPSEMERALGEQKNQTS
ncbi:MAG: Holliday junction resolvase-like protein [Archaeoglobales archaeon]|nr:Holliday junction resolvase-like protein [Archaeoglobales archaeon]